MTDEPTCPSCNVPYTDHLGLNGTCERLQLALDLLRDIEEWEDEYGEPQMSEDENSAWLLLKWRRDELLYGAKP